TWSVVCEILLRRARITEALVEVSPAVCRAAGFARYAAECVVRDRRNQRPRPVHNLPSRAEPIGQQGSNVRTGDSRLYARVVPVSSLAPFERLIKLPSSS